MIEKTVLEFLSSTLSVPSFLELPENPPGAFVLIEKTGSGKLNRICTATIAVQSYACSLLAAATLNEQVKNAMESMDELEEVTACRLNTDYSFLDTAIKRYRYQAVFDITHY